MTMKPIKFRTIAGAVAAALLVGTGAAFATDGEPSSDPSAPPPRPAKAAQTMTVPAELSDAFAILRGPASPGTNAAADDTSYGVNRELIRTVTTDAIGSVRIIPGGSGVCLEVDDPAGGSGGSCQSISGAKAGALAISLRDQTSRSDRAIVGLVPDGVSNVTVDNTTINVSNNVWSARTTSGDHTASFTDASGSHAISVP